MDKKSFRFPTLQHSNTPTLHVLDSPLKGLFQVPVSKIPASSALNFYQNAFGYTEEEIQAIITPMVINAQEPVGSMGNDAAPAVLSERPQLLYNYFKQIFAQVTNPPIDPYRENLVMSLMSFIGHQSNLLEESPEHCRQLKLNHPIFTNDDLERLRSVELHGIEVCTVPIHFNWTSQVHALEKGIEDLRENVEHKVREGYSCIILSDRGIDKYISYTDRGISSSHAQSLLPYTQV